MAAYNYLDPETCRAYFEEAKEMRKFNLLNPKQPQLSYLDHDDGGTTSHDGDIILVVSVACVSMSKARQVSEMCQQ